MNFETGKKVLRIAGILTIIGGVFSLLLAALGIFGGGAVASNPGIEADAELQQTAGMAIAAGLIFLLVALLSLVEGIVCYRAGKTGRKKTATVAMFLAVLSTIMNISNQLRAASQGSNIASVIINVALNILVIYAAYVVRQNAEA